MHVLSSRRKLSVIPLGFESTVIFIISRAALCSSTGILPTYSFFSLFILSLPLSLSPSHICFRVRSWASSMPGEYSATVTSSALLTLAGGLKFTRGWSWSPDPLLPSKGWDYKAFSTMPGGPLSGGCFCYLFEYLCLCMPVPTDTRGWCWILWDKHSHFCVV